MLHTPAGATTSPGPGSSANSTRVVAGRAYLAEAYTGWPGAHLTLRRRDYPLTCWWGAIDFDGNAA